RRLPRTRSGGRGIDPVAPTHPRLHPSEGALEAGALAQGLFQGVVEGRSESATQGVARSARSLRGQARVEGRRRFGERLEPAATGLALKKGGQPLGEGRGRGDGPRSPERPGDRRAPTRSGGRRRIGRGGRDGGAAEQGAPEAEDERGPASEGDGPVARAHGSL